ncbi:cache domain-containing protein [Massilia sp. TS11]|uniref:cache domain-containing protein n=1 Tax=Massilia sp. TS11 TaxID=2908003 RepID=UPI001EDBB6F3|nr:cache domain-containing protein [Massilia sp. TS11]MCG2584061.1 cache domain-containing protein [Massilia sp. TS11]
MGKFAWGLCLLCLAGLVQAGEPSAKDAIAMAERGAQFVKQHGKDAMIEKIKARDPEFNQGALYLAMRDLQGITVAHPTAAFVGKNLLEVPDADGKLFRKEMLAVAREKGKGWVDYKYKNPDSGKVEAKSTYVLRVGDVALEAGIYKR